MVVTHVQLENTQLVKAIVKNVLLTHTQPELLANAFLAVQVTESILLKMDVFHVQLVHTQPMVSVKPVHLEQSLLLVLQHVNNVDVVWK